MTYLLRISTLSLYKTNHIEYNQYVDGFDEMWYIVEYFIVNIFSFFVVFDGGKQKSRIIFIHDA